VIGDKGESVGDICCDCGRLESALNDRGLTAGWRCCWEGAGVVVIPARKEQTSLHGNRAMVYW